ncbi:PAS domain-containing protein [Streptomyces sp. NPDC093085]|uniref:helix-turn-helix transcriptional regulator n=1 Tax=Streptomyces sp. NPDC093085 TaxID=3155068 RepID=UPI003413159E
MRYEGAPTEWPGDAVAWRNRALTLFDRLPAPLALCAPDGRVLMANPAMAAEWGELPGRLLGRSALDLFRTEGPGTLRPIAEALRQGRRSRYAVEVSWPVPGGGERYGALTVDLLGHESDAVLLLLLRVDGERPAPPEAAARDESVRAGAAAPGGVGPAETRILVLVASGRTTAQIAREVGLTADGVAYHLGRLSRRWGVGNRAALVARAYATGVLAPGVWPPAAARGAAGGGAGGGPGGCPGGGPGGGSGGECSGARD